ncbi:IS21 family transposase [Listeria fleischmannii]|uniref:IS21 family transposase n=1 Tax=Listeria fleischmannii TaxID=1069827 RepID=UPI000254F9D0|nr:IS21 family transposase [Listeria fleischmannii]EIA21412.1 integrase catalytic subunit [Listeria fleischmannii subsp. coloradonensis]STY35264.1 Transposase and inactivated derivatives [Listeria fleischmannii subsp. coloradonensis]
MEIQLNINTTMEIKSLSDLPRLQLLMENLNMKINKSQLARELQTDRRTIDKYLNGFVPKTTRQKKSKIDPYYPIICQLLSTETKQVFYYKRILWQYLKDQHGLSCSVSNFRSYIQNHPELNAYFKQQKRLPSSKGIPRFETPPGKQAQLDWKEDLTYITKEGESLTIHVAVLLLGHSRFRIYYLSLSRSQEALFHFLTTSFETLGGVPQELVTDNMKTVMDEARTAQFPGKINAKFQQFSHDFGFTVKPCIARRPQTKGKIESPMKFLDEIYAYQQKLSFSELKEYLQALCQRINHSLHQGTGKIPILVYQKEKEYLQPLPSVQIRDHYRLVYKLVKVNASAMISYKGNFYSVPLQYRSQTVGYQVLSNNIYIYKEHQLIACHRVTHAKLNYDEQHYIENLQHVFPEGIDVTSLAKRNLEQIGEFYQ